MWKLGMAVLALSSSLALASERCEYSTEQELTVNDVQHLQLAMNADHLKVVGGKGYQVEVTAKFCASSQQRLDEMTLEPQQHGQSLQLKLLPERRSNQFSSGLFRRGGNYAWFDLTIEVPAAMLLDLILSSGSASIENIAGLELVLSSGRVQASRITGPVSSTVSSGQFSLTEAGAVQLHALSSGQVTLSQVGAVQASSVGSGRLSIEASDGDVSLSNLGSGQIRASNVQGSLKIDRIGSGSARVSDIAGHAEFGSIGSGSIRAERIEGDLSLRRQGSGSIRHEDVRGQVSLPSR